MADGEVTINTKLDISGLEKALKDLKNKLDEAGKTIDAGAKKGKGFADNLKGISTGAVAAAGTVAGVAVAVKKTVDALNACAAAYRVQQNAEEALQVAAKNNPYLNDESVYNLRQFASELQSMSEIGDEVSLQVMSQLAATGRNEEQIMQIMSAAADMAAVTGQDLGSAAQQLNATLNGNAGALGRQIGAINNLTKEELEHGDAVELVAQKYKGVAAATADVEVQLSNSWGDFKENIGRGWQTVTQPVKQFFLDVLNDINEATARTNALKDAKKSDKSGTATAADTKLLLEDAQNRLTNLQEINKNYVKETAETVKSLEDLQAEWDTKYGRMNPRMRRSSGAPARPTSTGTSNKKGGAYIEAAAQGNEKEIESLEKEIERLTNQYTALKDAEDKATAAAQAATDAADKRTAAQKRADETTEWINSNTKALQEQIKAMQLKEDVTGEEVDAGEIYNAYLQSYIDLITASNGLVDENNQAAKDRLATLLELAEAAKTATDEETRLANAQKMQAEATALMKDIDDGKHKTAFDEYDEKNKQLEEWRKKVDQYEKDGVMSEQAAADAKLEIDRQYWQNKKDLAETITAEINGYVQQTADIAQQAGDLMLETSKNEATAEQAELEAKYLKGEISEEEYNEKVTESKKKAAKEQYKLQMWQWSASLLQATANIAEGVSKAMDLGFPQGLIAGALVGAAGGVQIASIIASKPTPPSFSTGGIIGGSSTHGDNIAANLNSREMIMNMGQQKALWDFINGGANGGGNGTNIVINNSASNIATAQPKITRDKIEIMIDARVNDSMKKGRYDQSLNVAQQGMSGDYYGI